MSKTLLIIVSVLLIAVIATAAFFLFRSQKPSATSTQNPFAGATSSSVPGSSGTGATTEGVLTVPTYDNAGTVSMHDFRNDQNVTEDPQAPGTYYLAGNYQDLKAPYLVFYSDVDQSFHIGLYAEPLGQNRKAAEQALMSELGISQADMCKLNYVVAVGRGVDDIYLGKNLGFSFCPGAVALPN